MALIEEFENIGNWLFRKRSYLPLVLFVFGTILIYFDRNEFANHSSLSFSLICLAISFLGLFVRIFTIGFVQKGTFGRNVSGQVADALNTKDIYSIVRHPLYLGNYLIWLGIIIYIGSFWFIIVISLIFWLYYERIMFAEESFLRNKFKDDYINWSAKTPAFIPNLKLWQKSEFTFSFKDVIKREFNGLTAISVTFAYLDFIKNYFYYHKFYLDTFWFYFLVICVLLFIIIRFLKKKTKVLNAKR